MIHSEIDIEDKDGAIIFKEDTTVNIVFPKMEDEDVVPEYLQFVVALGVLLSQKDSKLYKYIWDSWTKRVDPQQKTIEKDIKEVVALMGELEETKSYNKTQVKTIIKCFCTIAKGWDEDQVKKFIMRNGE